MRIKIILPSLIGNVLEWYDFTLYGYFAAIFAHVFFPSSDKLLSTLMTFAVFAVGFLMRPVGAALFGYLGDRYGRKKTLAAAIILMAVSTTMIGLLPSYDQVGRLAGILLIICRLGQGLAVSGELCGTMVYVIEHANLRRGWYGSWTMASAFIGLLFGSLVSVLVTQYFTESSLYSWGWRIPFLISIVLGIIGLYLRLNMPETPCFEALKTASNTLVNPIRQAFQNEFGLMFKTLNLTALSASAFYFIFIYFSFYLKHYLGLDLKHALLINNGSMLLSIILMPILGLLSDRFGRKIFLLIGASGIFFGVYPMLSYVQNATLASAITSQLYLAVCLSFICGIIPVTLVELFQTKTRYTALAIPFNLSQALFGGTVPLIMTYAIELTGDNLAPAYFFMLISALVIITLLTMKETAKDSLT